MGGHCLLFSAQKAYFSLALLAKYSSLITDLGMTFSNQKSPTKPAVEASEAVMEEEEVRDDLDEVDGDVKNPRHLGNGRVSGDSGNYCQSIRMHASV